MLTERDIEIIKASREEMRVNRTEYVDVIFIESESKHPVTGEVEEVKTTKSIKSVVTIIATDTTETRDLYNGVLVYNGDIVVDISIKDMPSDLSYKYADSIIYDDMHYKVLTSVELGLGDVNRVEMLCRGEN